MVTKRINLITVTNIFVTDSSHHDLHHKYLIQNFDYIHCFCRFKNKSNDGSPLFTVVGPTSATMFSILVDSQQSDTFHIIIFIKLMYSHSASIPNQSFNFLYIRYARLCPFKTVHRTDNGAMQLSGRSILSCQFFRLLGHVTSVS